MAEMMIPGQAEVKLDPKAFAVLAREMNTLLAMQQRVSVLAEALLAPSGIQGTVVELIAPDTVIVEPKP